MKNTNILSTIKAIVLGLILSVGVGYIFADYSAPLTAPPTCTAGNPGCDAPLNVGPTLQTKGGGLILQSLTTQIFKLVDSTPTDDAGKVLTSDASGVASWQKPGINASMTYTMTKLNGTETMPLGTTNDHFSACFLTRVKVSVSDGGTLGAGCRIDYSPQLDSWSMTAEGTTGDGATCSAICF